MFGFFPFSGAPFSDLGAASVSVSVDATGVSGTGQVGVVTVQTNVDVSVTGVSGNGLVGQVAATGGADVLVTGVLQDR